MLPNRDKLSPADPADQANPTKKPRDANQSLDGIDIESGQNRNPKCKLMNRRPNKPPVRASARSTCKITAIPHAARAEQMTLTGHPAHGSKRIQIRPGARANLIERHDDDPPRPTSAITMKRTQRPPAVIIERKNRLVPSRSGIRNCARISQTLSPEHRHERCPRTASTEQRPHRCKVAEPRIEPDRNALPKGIAKRSKRIDMRATLENRAEIRHIQRPRPRRAKQCPSNLDRLARRAQ